MNQNMNSPILIEKEQIPNLSFPKSDSKKKTTDEIKLLNKKLKEYQILGNIHHSKVKIVFEDTEGLKEVRTTIWSADKDFIVLKKGIFIPLNHVISIAI